MEQLLNEEFFSEINYPRVFIGTILLLLHIFIINFFYSKYSRSRENKNEFKKVLPLFGLSIFLIISVIKTSLALSLGLVGALSIIRFRTVVKDTKDTAYIFWSLAAGMAAGTGSYFLAIIGTVIITSVAFILYYTNYGSFVKSEFILQFRIYNKSENSQDHIKILKKYTSTHTLLSSESSDDGKTIKLSYDIIMKEKYESNELIKELSKFNYLTELVIVAGKSDIDY